MESKRKVELLKELVFGLYAERSFERPAIAKRIAELRTSEMLWDEFRALVNTRPPIPAGTEWLAMQDELLEGMLSEKGIASLDDDAETGFADPRMRLWQGDITTLAVDAIVNAANSQMLGCWQPGHYCIDNAIHTFAGVQLRCACADIINAQGHEEPTGHAKMTDAYNLPSKHVIHTVGPIANGAPTAKHRAQLAACYRSCLDLAREQELESIAFCCISTGVFGFPRHDAAEIAVRTVRGWLDENDSGITVVFDVFGDADRGIYRTLLA